VNGAEVFSEIEMSPTIGALVGALSKAQGVMGGAPKDGLGHVGKEDTGRKYHYATLGSVLDAARAPLAANELAIIQTTTNAGPGGVCVVTTLAHSSGEWIRGRLPMPARDNTAQGLGSAMTYARRYAAAAIIGIAPADDDAAEATNGQRDRPAHAAHATRPAARPATVAKPALVPAPEAGSLPASMTPAELAAVALHGPAFASVKVGDARHLKEVREAASRGVRPISPAYTAWFWAMVDATCVRIGAPRPRLAKTHPATPAAANGVVSS